MKNTSSVDVKDKSLVDKDTIIKKYEALGFAENGMQCSPFTVLMPMFLKWEFKIF